MFNSPTSLTPRTYDWRGFYCCNSLKAPSNHAQYSFFSSHSRSMRVINLGSGSRITFLVYGIETKAGQKTA